jgi:hypothetical protein
MTELVSQKELWGAMDIWACCGCVLPIYRALFIYRRKYTLKVSKRGLKKYAEICTHGSINVCYVHTNSMVHPEAIFLTYPQKLSQFNIL